MKVTFSGFDFTIVDIGARLPSIPGCYVFIKEGTALGGEWMPVYFGETEDLSKRFDNHHAMPCIERNGATHMGVFWREEFKDETLRQDIEKYLIDENPTPCNKT